jgi:hypothetical protein
MNAVAEVDTEPVFVEGSLVLTLGTMRPARIVFVHEAEREATVRWLATAELGRFRYRWLRPITEPTT